MTILPECKTRSVHAWLPHQILGLIFRPETHSRHNNSDDPLHSSIDEEFEVLFCTLHANCLHHFNIFLKKTMNIFEVGTFVKALIIYACIIKIVWNVLELKQTLLIFSTIIGLDDQGLSKNTHTHTKVYSVLKFEFQLPPAWAWGKLNDLHIEKNDILYYICFFLSTISST